MPVFAYRSAARWRPKKLMTHGRIGPEKRTIKYYEVTKLNVETY
jgi:hypothetical protein